jgi:hypothetical protein
MRCCYGKAVGMRHRQYSRGTREGAEPPGTPSVAIGSHILGNPSFLYLNRDIPSSPHPRPRDADCQSPPPRLAGHAPHLTHSLHTPPNQSRQELPRSSLPSRPSSILSFRYSNPHSPSLVTKPCTLWTTMTQLHYLA